ncbi:hypothetical protein ABZY58_25980 [Micromonospora tulbaghiae]|uniref:hypothetical protein n=1 Tax=Micromonospora tulbaghiae TaxID=479978 RepID=UPI0033BF1C7B
MTDVDAILTGAKPAEDTVPICTRGDLVNQWRQLAKELTQAKAAAVADPRVAGDGTDELVRRLEDLRAQVEASTVPFELRALAPKRWAELVAEHPPRDGDEEDLRMQVNRETFLPVLVRLSTVSPQLKDETWAALLNLEGQLLSRPQWSKLWRACWNLNVQDQGLPFSVAGLLRTPDSFSGSGSPEPSA